MISEQALSRICRPAVLGRARIIVRRGLPILDKSCSYEGQDTVLSARVTSSSGYADSYRTSIVLDEAADQVVSYRCTCPAARSYPGPCKHAIALALDFNRDPASYRGFSALEHVETTSALKTYLDRQGREPRLRTGASSTEHEGSVSLELTLVHQQDLFCRFRIRGTRGAYVVKDLGQLADLFREGAFHEYGKRLAFDHVPAMLDEASRPVLAFIGRAVANRRSFSAQRLYGRVFATPGASTAATGRELRLSGPEIDELIGLYLGRTLLFEGAGSSAPRELSAEEGDPDLSLDIVDGSDDSFELKREGAAEFFSSDEHLYAAQGDRLLRCSDGYFSLAPFMEGVWDSSSEHVMLARDDARRFAATALPRLEEALPVKAPGFLEDLKPRECRIGFYLDRDAHGVTCDAVASYGEKRYHLFGSALSAKEAIGRDLDKEARARALVSRYLQLRGSGLPHLSARSTDAIARLLFEGLDEMREMGTVQASDSFQRLVSHATPRVSLGLAVREKLIDLSVSAEDLPLSELYAVLQSYREKKRFHRLRDGSYLDLSKADLAEAAEVADELSLTSKQLSQGTVEIPPYKAFLLDNIMSDEEKDASFEGYLEQVRSVDLSSYEVPAALQARLRPYQVEGYQWLCGLADMGFGGILADEMGLGKSVQLIAFLLARRGRGTSLIVCPASLVYNWQAEFAKFTPSLDVCVVAGTAAERRRLRAEKGREVFITSYDLCRRDIEDWAGLDLFCEVLDEAQYIKNRETLMAKAVKVIRARHRFALTGTPIENRLSELWSIFDYLMPGLLGSYERFRERYEEPISGGDGESAARLHAAVGPFILRRLKKDVLKDLPEKMEQVVYAPLAGEQRQLYQAREQALRVSLSKESAEDFGQGKLQVLAELTRLRQICCDPRLVFEDYDGPSAKLQAICELVSSVADSQQKMLVFSQFTSYLDLIAEELDRMGLSYYVITGSTPKKRRLELVDAFNGDATPVFLISLKAGGTGLNLVGASVVIHADPWWNAAAQDQATDRAHRIGQTHDVTVYKVIAKDTIEDRILALQEAKSDLAEQVIGSGEGMSLSRLTREDLIDLLG